MGERLGNDPAEGPKNSQASAVMGNSEAAWHKHYDTHASIRDTQAACDASVQWRRAMLEKGLQKSIALHEKELIENGM